MLRRVIRSKLAGESAQYMIWQLVGAAMPFLALPFLTRALSPEQYGLFAMFSGVLLFIIPLVNIGFLAKLNRDFAGQDKRATTIQISTSFMLCCLIALLVLVMIIAFSQEIYALTGIPPTWQWLWPFLALSSFVANLVFTFAEMTHRPTWYGVWRVGQALIFYAGAIILILSFALGWQGMVIAQIMSMIFIMVGGGLWLNQHGYIKPAFVGKVARDALRYALPLLPYSIGIAVITLSDRLVIKHFHDVETTGPYLVAYQLATGVFICVTALRQAWTPWFNERLHQQETAIYPVIRKALFVAILSVVGLAAAYFFFSPILVWILVGPEFQQDVYLTRWLGVAFGFYGLYGIIATMLLFQKRTIIVGLFTGLAAVLNVVLNFWLVPDYAAVGAAFASCLTFLILFIMGIFFAWRDWAPIILYRQSQHA